MHAEVTSSFAWFITKERSLFKLNQTPRILIDSDLFAGRILMISEPKRSGMGVGEEGWCDQSNSDLDLLILISFIWKNSSAISSIQYIV